MNDDSSSVDNNTTAPFDLVSLFVLFLSFFSLTNGFSGQQPRQQQPHRTDERRQQQCRRQHDRPFRLDDYSSSVNCPFRLDVDSTTTAAASTAPFDSTTTAAASTAAVSDGCWTKDGRTDGWARRRQCFFFFFFSFVSLCFVLSLFSLTNGQQQRRQQQCQTDAGRRMDGWTAGLVAGNAFFFFFSS